MKTLARLVIRKTSDKDGGLILGMLFKNAMSKLKVNTIYELQEVLGELSIKELGPSAIGDTRRESLLSGICWCNDITTVVDVAGPQLVLTQNEYRHLIAKGSL
jgi:hypothetical protein